MGVYEGETGKKKRNNSSMKPSAIARNTIGLKGGKNSLENETGKTKTFGGEQTCYFLPNENFGRGSKNKIPNWGPWGVKKEKTNVHLVGEKHRTVQSSCETATAGGGELDTASDELKGFVLPTDK